MVCTFPNRPCSTNLIKRNVVNENVYFRTDSSIHITKIYKLLCFHFGSFSLIYCATFYILLWSQFDIMTEKSSKKLYETTKSTPSSSLSLKQWNAQQNKGIHKIKPHLMIWTMWRGKWHETTHIRICGECRACFTFI